MARVDRLRREAEIQQADVALEFRTNEMNARIARKPFNVRVLPAVDGDGEAPHQHFIEPAVVPHPWRAADARDHVQVPGTQPVVAVRFSSAEFDALSARLTGAARSDSHRTP